MSDEHLQAAARALIARDPEIGRHFSIDEVAERLRVVLEALKLEAMVRRQID